MARNRWRPLAVESLCSFTLAVGLTCPVFAQMDCDAGQIEVLPSSTVLVEMETLAKQDDEMRLLDATLRDRGFRPLTETNNLLGLVRTHERDGRRSRTMFYLQDYAPANGNDIAALGQITVEVGDRSKVYAFYLLAPTGNLNEAEEYAAEADNAGILHAVRQHSWWTCVKARLEESSQECAASIVKYTPELAHRWVAYLGCVAGQCALADGKVAGCCACDCSWWCRLEPSFGVGCCYANNEGGSITILDQFGNPTHAISKSPYDVGDAVGVGHLDGVGRAEIAIGEDDGGAISILDQAGNPLRTIPKSAHDVGDRLAVGDVGRNGRAEIVVAEF